MALQEKYKKVLDLGLEFEVKDGDVQEVDGILKISGTTATQYQKDKMWDTIKEVAGADEPSDLVANIKVENTEYYHKHTVQKGETLGKIAKNYYGDAMKYKDIFEANTDQLKNPDLIHPDQELVIPFVEA